MESDAAVGTVDLHFPDADLDGVHRGFAFLECGYRLPDAHVAVVRRHDNHRVFLSIGG